MTDNFSTQNTQFPLWDRVVYKSALADVLQNHVAVPILKIVSDVLGERLGKGLEEAKKEPPRGKSDFLTHFMHIQATNPDIPSW